MKKAAGISLALAMLASVCQANATEILYSTLPANYESGGGYNSIGPGTALVEMSFTIPAGATATLLHLYFTSCSGVDFSSTPITIKYAVTNAATGLPTLSSTNSTSAIDVFGATNHQTDAGWGSPAYKWWVVTFPIAPVNAGSYYLILTQASANSDWQPATAGGNTCQVYTGDGSFVAFSPQKAFSMEGDWDHGTVLIVR